MSGLTTIALGLVAVGVAVMVVALVAMLLKRRSSSNDWAGPRQPPPGAPPAGAPAEDLDVSEPVWKPEPPTHIDDTQRYREQNRPDEPTRE